MPDMKKIIIVIERSADLFDAYSDNCDGIYGAGNSIEECKKDIKERRAEPVPLQLRNAPTGLMKELHYGEGYQYAHDTEEKLTKMECLPESLKDRNYYRPTGIGQEKQVKERLEQIKAWKRQK